MMGQSPFHDHFSERAPGYAAYRPGYPRELVDYLFDSVTRDLTMASANSQTVWEAGCGSGQLTQVLAERFQRVIATDASAEQIARAEPHRNVEYRITLADASGLPDHSVELAVAAQAAHWFDLDRYYEEVRRVVRPGGLVALIVYGIHISDDPKIDKVVKEFYGPTLSAYWPPQRKLVEEEYRTIPFPFAEIHAPKFEMKADWNLEEMLGYVETWSAVGVMAKAEGRGPIDEFRRELGDAWKDKQVRRTIRWPLSMRMGRCT